MVCCARGVVMAIVGTDHTEAGIRQAFFSQLDRALFPDGYAVAEDNTA